MTLLSVELQSSRSVPRDLRDDLYLQARRELRTDKNTFQAITLLSFEPQSSRSVQNDQRDETSSIFTTGAPSAQTWMRRGLAVIGNMFFAVLHRSSIRRLGKNIDGEAETSMGIHAAARPNSAGWRVHR